MPLDSIIVRGAREPPFCHSERPSPSLVARDHLREGIWGWGLGVRHPAVRADDSPFRGGYREPVEGRG